MLYRNMQTASFQPRLFSHLIYLKGQRFKELIEYDRRGAMIRSRVQEIEGGEKPKKRWNVIRKINLLLRNWWSVY